MSDENGVLYRNPGATRTGLLTRVLKEESSQKMGAQNDAFGRRPMSAGKPSIAPEWLRKTLNINDLSYKDFMNLALYDREAGYYSKQRNPVGEGGDFVTSPSISPAFGFALARLAEEFVSGSGDEASAIVDIGCGDGALIAQLADQLGAPASRRRDAGAPFIAIDRTLERVPPERRSRSDITFATSLEAIPEGARVLAVCNELFDALPVARVVQREERLRELTVHLEGEDLVWGERDAAPDLVTYFQQRDVRLLPGQFADVTREWGDLYRGIAKRVSRGMIVTFDYGFEDGQLFDPRIRRWGTAAAYAGHQVSRDLLRNPGEQDLTAHINFSDLRRAGEEEGFRTLLFSRQASFLLSLGITQHPLFRPVHEVESRGLADSISILERRQAAQRLILPDGIGEEMRVLVQTRGE